MNNSVGQPILAAAGFQPALRTRMFIRPGRNPHRGRDARAFTPECASDAT
jgi:hypothetical protein